MFVGELRIDEPRGGEERRTFGSGAVHAERDLFPYWPATWKKAARWLFPLAALAVLTESRLLCASGTRAKPGLVPEGKADLSPNCRAMGILGLQNRLLRPVTLLAGLGKNITFPPPP